MAHRNVPIKYDIYEKASSAAAKALAKAAKGSGNYLLEEIAEEEKELSPENMLKTETRVQMIEQVMREGIEQFREGECSFKDAVDKITSALKLIRTK